MSTAAPRPPDGAVPRRQRVVVWILVLLALTGLAWSFLGEIDVVVTAEGRLVADGNAKIVQAPQSGTVRAILVKEGQLVQQNAPLIELDTSVHAAELRAVQEKLDQARMELARLEAERTGRAPRYPGGLSRDKILAQESLRLSRQANYRQRMDEISSAVQARRAALDTGEVTLRGLQRRHEIASLKEQKAAPHVDVAVPRFQFYQLKDEVVLLEKDIQSQRELNVKLRFDIDESSRKLAQVTTEYQAGILSEISERMTRITQLESDLDRARKILSDDAVRAPVDGHVQYVNVSTVGASITAADQLMIIVPADSPLIVEAFLGNEDRGFAKPGQPVDIKVDAFPYQRYGKLAGKLLWISPDAEDYASATRRSPSPFAPSSLVGPQRNRYVYRVRVQPAGVRLQDASITLSAGMTVKVDIQTDKRRVIDFLLFPIEESLEKGMRVN